MVWVIIVAVLLMQYFLNIRSFRFQFNWVESYVGFCNQRLSKRFDIDLLSGYCFLFIVAAIFGTVVLMLFKFIFPAWVYSLMGGILFWYVVDIRKLSDSEASILTPELLLRQRIQRLFAPVFFYAMFFSPLVLFYYVVLRELNAYQVGAVDHAVETQDSSPIFYWVNWLPVKLLGLTFAVVGHFRAVISIWRARIFSSSISHSQNLSMLSQAAVAHDKPGGAGAMEEDFMPSRFDVCLSNELCEHALVVWLLTIFIVCLVAWLG